MKIAIITDTHYGFKKGNKIFHDYFEKFYSNIFFPYLKKNKIKTVIHLGDSFDSRKGIDYWSLRWAKENVYDKYLNLGISLYKIIGNHDIYYKNTNILNSPDYLLSNYSNITTISNPQEIKIDNLSILMVPWITSENQDEVNELISKSSSSVVMGHLELNGFKVNSKMVSDHGYNPDIFNKFNKVFSGHYHTRSNNGKVYYLGNPYEMFWTDHNDLRGFTIFDTETLSHTHINNPYRLFEIVEYDEDNEDYNFSEYTDKILKVIIKNKVDIKKYENFFDKLVSFSPHDIKVVETVQTLLTDVNVECDSSENTLTLLEKYVDESETSLNRDKIKRLITQIYQNSYQV
jgi:DNA repair exonuclease SbcCD nuclease subunit